MNATQLGLRVSFRVDSPRPSSSSSLSRRRVLPGEVKLRAADIKPSICTADELHYVSIPGSDWSLALWRYRSPPKVTPRNHPLLLLSGVGTNAIGFDLSPPEVSFARNMCQKGFDTWTLEVRGAGLSVRQVENRRNQWSVEGAWSTSNFGEGIKDISQRITREGWPHFQPAFFELHEQISSVADDFQEHMDLLLNNDWDLDEYLKEDIPVVMEYIRSISKPRDGEILAVGHSMGGILLYALLSLCGFQGRGSGLRAVVTLGSSLDYSSSKSSMKLLLPLVEPTQALKVPSVPIGAMVSALHPLASRPPYALSWLKSQFSTKDTMLPELVEKLALNSFCTVPAKLLLQLSTVLKKGGLRDRSGTFAYKDHLHKSNVPIMALAGDEDLICPLEAVYETVKVVPEHLVTFKVFGEPGGPNYAHYDIVGGRTAPKQVHQSIVEFLGDHDSVQLA